MSIIPFVLANSFLYNIFISLNNLIHNFSMCLCGNSKLWFCGDHISCLFVHLFVILILTHGSLFLGMFGLFVCV